MIKIVYFFILVFFSLLNPVLIYSQNISEIETKIAEYTKKIEELSKAKDTLSNQIKYLDSQVELTILKISQTEETINTIKKEIAILTTKIDQLDISLNKLSAYFINQINQNYRLQKKVPPFSFVFYANFNDFLNQYKYISVAQTHSQNTLLNWETDRTNFDIQKEAKKKKQSELELMEKTLASQKISLANQKNTKSNLLYITKNDETRYQKLKQEAENELKALLAAQFTGKKVYVKKGDPIGLMGSTGYSTGPHLHFGVYNLKEEDIDKFNYYQDTDAVSYLGSHRWPFDTLNSINAVCNDSLRTNCISQGPYGSYSHSKVQAIDMVSSDPIIHAVNDGWAYYFKDKYPNQKIGSGNHVRIFHSDGKMTLYLHLQSATI